MEETGGLRRRLRRYWAMRKDPDESAMLTASLSFFVNAAIGVGKLLLGIGLGSFWFVVNGAYYLLLCIARGRAVGQYRRALAMDGGARQALAQAGIQIYGGVQGRADLAVTDLLAGRLLFNPEELCSHHGEGQGEGHHCGGHSCADHSCHN